jgi:hypothetical protein
MTNLLESQSKEGILLKEIPERGEEGISPGDLISPNEKRSRRRSQNNAMSSRQIWWQGQI